MNSRKSRTPGAVILAIISAGVVTCGLIAFMLFSASRSERIFLLSNEQITVTGYDGNGRVSDTFHPEYYGIRQISVSDSHRKDLISSVDCGAYPSSGLSNGDIVTYSCTYDHAAASAAGIHLERTVKTYRVTGLTAYSEVDLFAGVTAEWSDNSEHPVILHIPDQFTSSGIQYSTGFGGDTYNGHSVFIYASCDEERMHMFGMTPVSTMMEMEMGEMPAFRNTKKKNTISYSGGSK